MNGMHCGAGCLSVGEKGNRLIVRSIEDSTVYRNLKMILLPPVSLLSRYAGTVSLGLSGREKFSVTWACHAQ